jgi:AraC-like DNA-binding protein
LDYANRYDIPSELVVDAAANDATHVLNRRLERAAELLCDSRHVRRRIGDIAFEVGFVDLSYFNRAFRRRFGDTPSGTRAAASRRK